MRLIVPDFGNPSWKVWFLSGKPSYCATA